MSKENPSFSPARIIEETIPIPGEPPQVLNVFGENLTAEPLFIETPASVTNQAAEIAREYTKGLPGSDDINSAIERYNKTNDPSDRDNVEELKMQALREKADQIDAKNKLKA